MGNNHETLDDFCLGKLILKRKNPPVFYCFFQYHFLKTKLHGSFFTAGHTHNQVNCKR